MDEKFKTESGKWDLEKIVRICEEDLRKIKIPIQRILEVHVVRDKYVFGRVEQEYYDETCFGLYISNFYRSRKYELAEVKAVICHLLLHTIKDCMAHDGKWQEYAEKADREYGLHIIGHAASRPKAGANWYGVNTPKTTKNSEKCCLLDYLARLEELTRECSDELINIGLNVGRVSKVVFSKDDSAYGRCKKNKDKTYTICVSYSYAEEEADLFGLKGLICHELLHTCPGDDTVSRTGVHGPRWREMARKVERECGYRLMSQSHSDAVRQTPDKAKMRYVCPVCGGYYDVHEDRDKRKAVYCKWCRYEMNKIREEDMGVIDNIYILIGELRDRLRIEGIPVGIISGVGFVSADRATGLHDNWNRRFSIDLPVIYKRHGVVNDDGLKVYLCRELSGHVRDAATMEPNGKIISNRQKWLWDSQSIREIPII